MGNVISMDEKALAVRLRSDATNAPKAVYRAMVSSALKGRAFLVIDKSVGTPVDRGILRNAWKIVKSASTNSVQLVNDQPYAGVMERGARPFKMGREGIESMKAWVGRQLRAGRMFATGASMSIKVSVNKKTGARFHRKKNFALRGEKFTRAVESITWAIVKTIEKIGIKGRRFVMNNLDKLAALMDDEMKRSLDNFFSRALGSKG